MITYTDRKERQRDHALWLQVMQKAPRFALVVVSSTAVQPLAKSMHFKLTTSALQTRTTENDKRALALFPKSWIDSSASNESIWITMQSHTKHPQAFRRSLSFVVVCGRWIEEIRWRAMKHNDRVQFCRMLFGKASMQWMTFPFPDRSFAQLVKWFHQHGG